MKVLESYIKSRKWRTSQNTSLLTVLNVSDSGQVNVKQEQIKSARRSNTADSLNRLEKHHMLKNILYVIKMTRIIILVTIVQSWETTETQEYTSCLKNKRFVSIFSQLL